MKKLLFCLTLVLGIVLMSATSSWAVLIHDAGYHWKSGGTYVVQTTPYLAIYNVGSPTGDDLIEVFEKVYDLDGTNGDFEWYLKNDAYNDIYSFHVPSFGFAPTSYGGPTGWSFSYDSSFFTWTTTTDPFQNLPGKRDGTFYVIVPTTSWGISTAAVDVDIAHSDWRNGDGFWVTSHPTPEPSSMLLLGMGVLGLFGLRRKKVA